jgi:hypothetical protein
MFRVHLHWLPNNFPGGCDQGAIDDFSATFGGDVEDKPEPKKRKAKIFLLGPRSCLLILIFTGACWW